MKKTHLIILTCFLISGHCMNGQLRYGPRVGIGMSSLGGGNGSMGFQAGLFVNAELKDRMGLQPEILFTVKNGSQDLKIDNPNGNPLLWKKKYSFTYLDIPFYFYVPISR